MLPPPIFYLLDGRDHDRIFATKNSKRKCNRRKWLAHNRKELIMQHRLGL